MTGAWSGRLVRLALSAAVGGLLFLLPVGAAAAPFTVAGDGFTPDVAVSADGTGHVVWSPKGPQPQATRYCRIARGTSACAPGSVRELAVPSNEPGFDSEEVPHVFTDGASRVVVLAHHCCGNYATSAGTRSRATFVFVSDDGGHTFAGAVPVTTATPSADAILVPGNTVAMLTDSSNGLGQYFVSTPLGGFVESSARLGETTFQNGSLGLLPDNRLVAAMLAPNPGADDQVVYRVHNGTGDRNDVASWSAPVGLGSGTRMGQLAHGPGGTYLLHFESEGAHRMVVRRWTGSEFGPPAPVGPIRRPLTSFTQDGSGRLFALYSLGSGDEYRYRTSPDGVAWSCERRLLAAGEISDFAFGVAVSAAADGRGFAVYQHPLGEGRYEIRGVALEDSVEVCPPPDPPPPPPPPTVAPPLDPPVRARAIALTRTTARLRRLRLTLRTPPTCLPAGAPAALKLGVARSGRRAKVRSVRFALGAVRQTDRRAPFGASLPTSGFASGKVVPVSATVTARIGRKTARKVLRGTIELC